MLALVLLSATQGSFLSEKPLFLCLATLVSFKGTVLWRGSSHWQKILPGVQRGSAFPDGQLSRGHAGRVSLKNTSIILKCKILE